MHVRRTDKSKEADPVALEKYVEQIEDYFDISKAEGHGRKKVFLATDEPEIAEKMELRTEFETIVNKSSVNLGNHDKNRYSLAGQLSIAKDVIYLSLADFMVCTFSSNVCRVAYALRMANKSLIGHLYEVVSLDSDWFILQEYQKIYLAKHDSIKYQGLQFKQGELHDR